MGDSMKLLEKISEGYIKGLKIYLEILLVAMLVTMGMQVFCRFVLYSPLAWSEELTCYLQVALVFPGIAWCVKEKAHIEMTFVYDSLSPAGKIIFDIARNIILVLIGAVFICSVLIFLTSQKQTALTMRWLRLDRFYLVILWGAVTAELYLTADCIRFFVSLFKKEIR